ncbi:MAG: hypothetical protein H3C38_09180 [Rhodospirillales bacterium]|nr:hypothetical protein [Rhodospirillales bacterium]
MTFFTDCTVTCPRCGHAQVEAMPGRLWALECAACGHAMHPPQGGCCVFCAYGDVPCPDAQREASCSCGTEGG